MATPDWVVLNDMLNEEIAKNEQLQAELAAVPRWTRIDNYDNNTWPPDKTAQVLHGMKSGKGWFTRIRRANELRGEIASHDPAPTIVDYWMPFTPPTEADANGN